MNKKVIVRGVLGILFALSLLGLLFVLNKPVEVPTEPQEVEEVDVHHLFSVDAPKRVQDVYRALLLHSSLHGNIDGTIYVYPDMGINAFVNGHRRVFVTRGFLHQVRNEDELAFILAHEIAHVMLGHLDGIRNEDNRYNEFHCDLIAITLMQKAGYNPCNVTKMWARWHMEMGTQIGTHSHPSTDQRAVYTYLPQCEATNEQ